MNHLIYALLVACTAIRSAVATPAPPPVSSISEEVDNFLATQHPNVVRSQMRYVGDVPENLNGLIRGASRAGRLVLPSPAPGHALLLTQVLDPITVRGFGTVTDHTGERFYFSTLPFRPKPIPSDLSRVRNPIHPQHYILPHSSDATLFPHRTIQLDLADGKAYKPEMRFALNHAAVLPLDTKTEQHDRMTLRQIGVYDPWIVDRVLTGRPTAMIDWSKSPNWLNRDKTLASISPTSWFRAVSKRLSTPKKSAASTSSTGDGGQEGDSPDREAVHDPTTPPMRLDNPHTH